MNPTYAMVAVVLVTIVTLAIGALGLRVSRTTQDFYVASRSVSPAWNSAAIGGEYLSAASFIGIAGLVLVSGVDMLWYPIGWTAGYLLLLIFVAAPLRRSGAYTIPDFAEYRLQSATVRTAAVVVVLAIGWLYLWPQFQGAGLVLQTVIGAPVWVGPLLVAAVVVVNVLSGGMRSITFVQAFQYWLKLTALLVPLVFLLYAWLGDNRPADVSDEVWSLPLMGSSGPEMYHVYAIIIATFLGTMGLPHVVVRFYTNPDGRAARRTTLIVLLLLGLFYVMPGIYGLLGRVYASELAAEDRADIVVIALPGVVIGGNAGELLGALLTAGAFAAFLSTSSGLTMALAGVGAQQLQATRIGRRLSGVSAIRVAAALGVIVPLLLALFARPIPVATTVGFAFALAASTFCPLILLGIWWRGLTATGAIAGLAGGGIAVLAATSSSVLWPSDAAWSVVLTQPAAWTVPLGFGLMILVSKLTADSAPRGISRMMARLHTPEKLLGRPSR